MFTRTFWRLFVGFIAVLVVSFVIFLVIGYYEAKPLSETSLANMLFR